jgi:O-antigen/teichoic acid export membrane protein
MVQLLYCFKIVPDLRRGINLERTSLGPLLRFGGWMTITNIISPLLVYMDRFFIGAIISISAVTYYATPSEVVTKILLVSGSLVGVLFPAFSTSFMQDRARTELLFIRGVKYVFIVIFPLTFFILSFAADGLLFWLGSEFAKNSTQVLQWITAGVFILSLGQVPFTLIQGAGRPDLTARLHLVELPFFILGLWLLIHINGIVGASNAWFFRICVDTVCMFFLAQRLIRVEKKLMFQSTLLIGGVLLIFVFATVPDTFVVKGLFFLTAMLLYGFITWFKLLDSDEKDMIRGWLKISGPKVGI